MIDRYFAIPLLFSMHVFAADYEVTIDGKTHAFVEGVEQTIQTAGGQIRVSVKVPRLKVCKEDGFTFDYPGDMKVEPEDLEGGIRQVTVEAIDSTIIMVQRYPQKMNAGELQESLVTGFLAGYRELGMVVPEKPTAECSRKIGASEVKGCRLSFAVGNVPHTTDVYVFTHGERTMAFVFQGAIEDQASTEVRFKAVAESLR